MKSESKEEWWEDPEKRCGNEPKKMPRTCKELVVQTLITYDRLSGLTETIMPVRTQAADLAS